MPTPGTSGDSSVARGCLVHTHSVCVPRRYFCHRPEVIPAFPRSHFCRTLEPGTAPLAIGLHSPLCPEQIFTPPRLSGLALLYKVGRGTPVGTAEWLWQPWLPFPLEMVALSDCHS